MYSVNISTGTGVHLARLHHTHEPTASSTVLPLQHISIYLRRGSSGPLQYKMNSEWYATKV